MNTLILGGFGMKSRHLGKIYGVGKRVCLENEWWKLLNPSFGHFKLLDTYHKSLGSNNIVHSISASVWSSHKLFDHQNVQKIVLESPPYLFDTKPLSNTLSKMYKLNPIWIETFLKHSLHYMGATPEWKSSFIHQIENIKKPTLILTSENDNLIPYSQHCELYEKLSSHNPNVHIHIFKNAHHGKYSRASEYNSVLKDFYHN